MRAVSWPDTKRVLTSKRICFSPDLQVPSLTLTWTAAILNVNDDGLDGLNATSSASSGMTLLVNENETVTSISDATSRRTDDDASC